MKSYTMTPEEASKMDSTDESIANAARIEIILKAKTQRNGNETMEIYHPDGYVVDVIQD